MRQEALRGGFGTAGSLLGVCCGLSGGQGLRSSWHARCKACGFAGWCELEEGGSVAGWLVEGGGRLELADPPLHPAPFA